VLDTVIDGKTGILFEEPVVHSIRLALEEVESQRWDRAAMRQHAATFSRAQFHRQFGDILRQVVG